MKKSLPLPIRKTAFLPAVLLLIIALFGVFSASAQNQTAKVTPQGTWYYEYLPPDYNSNTNLYPIVFFLHGLGERGDTETDLPAVARNGPPKYVKAGYKFPFILISPQLKTNKTGWPNTYIDQVIEYVRNNTGLRIDMNRIYLTGLSLGGGGSWGYIQDPVLGKKIAASVICCGHQNNTGKACNITGNGIPIWAFHGDADQTVSVSKTINMVNALNACIPAPNPLAMKTIYPGVGHNCWDRAYVTSVDKVNGYPDLSQSPLTVYEWLLQFKNGGTMVNAGADISLNQPINSTTITAVASTDAGTITTYTWTKVSGPSATLTNTGTPTLTLTNLNSAGVYTFRITVTSSTGDTATDDITVTVVAAANAVPVANAGADKAITLPTNTLTLTGTGSDADVGQTLTYAWTKVSGPTATLTNANTTTLSLSALLQGTYVFQLTVTDNLGASASDQVQVIVNPAAVNQAPTASAGADKTVNLPTSTANLVGSGSDPDGSISTYAWTKVSGPTVTMTNASTSTVSLSALVAGIYTFQLTVTDNQGATGSDQVQVTVIAANQSPTANAGADVTITLPTSTTNITGSGTDPDGSISTYAWTFVSGPVTPTLVNAATSTVTANGLSTAGAYTLRLTVTDNNGSTGFDDVKITVNAMPVNAPPTANAGVDQSITIPTNSIILNGSGTDPEAGSLTYGWTKVSGPTATLTGNSTASLTASNLVAGTYVFRLTVTDNQSATATDDVQVIVQPAVVNQLPIANAGGDLSITLPISSTTLNGSGNDPDGSISQYAWVKLTGPAATIGSPAAASTLISGLAAGVYTFQLTVTDNSSATASDVVTVTVNAANVPPVANAGPDKTITSPTSTVNITGSGSDVDGTVNTQLWTQVGTTPSVATLSGGTTFDLVASTLVQGTYTFRLTVTDDLGATGFDDVKVTVNAPANQAPTAIAGGNQTITLPTNTANFTGNGTDPDGTISSYAWTLQSSPGGSNPVLTNASSKTLTVSVDLNGSYTFRLTVTDDIGATDFDDVTLTVNQAVVNQPPVASAGANQTITLPVNSLNLTGSGSDPDGSIATYAWTKQSGPLMAGGDMTNTDKATVSLANLIEGVYTFRLTVTDNSGATAFAEATVTVLPAAVNQPPVANAGGNQIITTDNITLIGSGSDADGSVVTYLWEFVSGPATPVIANPDKATTAVTTLSALGVYTLSLTVTDDKGASDSDVITITVNAVATNQPPVANAGKDKVITLPTNIATLTGAGSDPDAGDFITAYSWMKVSGPAVTLGPTNTSSLSLSALLEGIYVFRLQVQDNNSNTATDDVKVTVLPASVNQSPVVTTDPDKSVFLPTNNANINGVASDADGSIKSLLWTQVSGPAIAPADFLGATTNNLSVVNLVAGVYTFKLTATDNLDATGSDITKVTVFADTVNQPPTANAGPDQTTKNTSVILNGSGSDPDGTIASYAWTKITGPSCSLAGATTQSLTVSSMQTGSYTFGLVVTDDKGKTSSQDQVNVTVLPAAINTPPVVDAGFDVLMQLPTDTTTLTGKASDDGTIQSYWKQISGPTDVITDSTFVNPLAIADLIEGNYVFSFSAKDDGGVISSDNVTITVEQEPAVIAPPTVNAGDSIYITLPENSVVLLAMAQSADGLIESYSWSSLDYSLSTADTTATLDVSGLTKGTYRFTITVTDNADQTASDDVIVIVEEGPYNVFTPNNKGPVETETWHIGDPTDFTSCEINVYNKQGMRVFYSKGYETSQEWNGTYNGQPVPEGVYFYVIGCPSKKTKTGTVTVIR